MKTIIGQFSASRSIPAIAVHYLLQGMVQGIGVRPAIANLAASLGLAGTIRNDSAGVSIVVEGDEKSVARFESFLPAALPSGAVVEEFRRESSVPTGLRHFEIVQQQTTGRLSTIVPRDLAVCAECLQESLGSTDRRAGYPMTSCTQCGPRYSLIRSMPYERSRTGMSEFELCPACRQEYHSTRDRRFHAQTNACPECGPKIWLAHPVSGRRIVDDSPRDSIRLAADAIASGKIVALRGIGGYQLVVDANCEPAVRRLRDRKGRPAKPLAVMIRNDNELSALAVASSAELSALNSPENPIVICQGLKSSRLAPSVSGGLNTIGLFLPTSGLHALLIRACRTPLVVTSGNVDGEPLAVESEDAERDLAGVADCWLHHDRPIVRAIDDSVVRFAAGKRIPIRLARGLAPLPVALRSSIPGLAIGGHQKVALALNNGATAVLGPHLGDMDSLAMRHRFVTHLEQLLELYGCRPEFIACDQHPDYFTTRWAFGQVSNADRARGDSVSLASVRQVIPVQHHHAHIACAMMEQGWQNETVLGVAFDGTGHGTDDTVWGGEFLLATLTRFDRVGHLLPFRLPVGDVAVREPWRVALSLLSEAFPGSDAASILRPCIHENLAADDGFHTREKEASLTTTLQWMRRARVTTSAGRLFDGAAALILGIARSTYEGEAAMQLESACDDSDSDCYEMPVLPGSPLLLDWRPAVRAIVRDARAGITPGQMAMRFHRGLARAIAKLCRRFPAHRVVLSGGVFQNRRLIELIADELPASKLGIPSIYPPNDGGLAVGQLAIASALVNPS